MDKKEFKAKAKQTIDNLFQQAEQLEQKTQELKTDAKAQYQVAVQNLQSQKTTLINKYKQLEQTTDENWETVREAFSNGVQAFKDTLAKTPSQ